MRAYSELLVKAAKTHLSTAFYYAIDTCGQDINTFANLFVESGIAALFEEGNPAVVEGMSGPELARAILSYSYGNTEFPAYTRADVPGPEYWVGWALAQYQWHSGKRFADIFYAVPASEILLMYPIYHEMDISHFYEEMDRRIAEFAAPSRLQTLRYARGLSQSELARLADVGVRNIQLYEQRVNNIDKAQVATLYRLSRVLGCRIEDLLEDPLAV